MSSASDIVYLLVITSGLWELCIIMFYFMYVKVLQPMGKFKAVRLQYRGGEWFLGGTKWVSVRARKWAMRTGETHTVEMDAAVITEGTHPWLFYDTKGTRPLLVTIQTIKHDLKSKSYNPDSEEFDKFSTRQALFQALKSNAMGNPGVLLFVVIAAVGFMLGMFASPYILPVHSYPAATTVKGP